MGSGADVAMHAAGITLMRGDIALVPAALDISRRTVAKIRQNLFWAFIYNTAGIPIYEQIKRQIDIHHDIAVVINDKFYVAVLTVPLVEFFMKNLRI